MSGAHIAWTPEQRARRAAIMRAKWADPEYRAKQAPALAKAARSPKARAAASRSMNAWHERRRTDADADATWRAALWRANGRPVKRAAMSRHMSAIQQRPDMQAHIRTLAKRTAPGRLNSAQRCRHRGGVVPPEREAEYRALIRKGLRAPEAFAALGLAQKQKRAA